MWLVFVAHENLQIQAESQELAHKTKIEELEETLDKTRQKIHEKQELVSEVSSQNEKLKSELEIMQTLKHELESKSEVTYIRQLVTCSSAPNIMGDSQYEVNHRYKSIP